MKTLTHPYSIFSLGDSAVTIDLGNGISEPRNQKVLAMQEWLQRFAFEGLVDIIPAYSSLTVIYDPVAIKRRYNPGGTVTEWVKTQLEKAFHDSGEQLPGTAVTVEMPVCYHEQTGIDLAVIAQQKKLEVEEIIHLHTSVLYRVYMIGFLPGFAYLAEVDPKLVMSRKARPVTVLPGSVGIAGAQTGIYPLASPGGWNIIGRTPVKLFDPVAPEPVKLKAGDMVRFYAISMEEFNHQLSTVN